MNKNEKCILINMNFGHFLSHFNMLVFPGLVIPLSIYLKMDIKDILPLSFYMYLLFGLSALPWGILGDKIRAKKTHVLFFILEQVFVLFLQVFFLENTMLFSLFLGGVGFFFRDLPPNWTWDHIKGHLENEPGPWNKWYVWKYWTCLCPYFGRNCELSIWGKSQFFSHWVF